MNINEAVGRTHRQVYSLHMTFSQPTNFLANTPQLSLVRRRGVEGRRKERRGTGRRTVRQRRKKTPCKPSVPLLAITLSLSNGPTLPFQTAQLRLTCCPFAPLLFLLLFLLRRSPDRKKKLQIRLFLLASPFPSIVTMSCFLSAIGTRIPFSFLCDSFFI